MITVKVNAEIFRKFLKVRAAASAVARKEKALRAEMSLPEADKDTVGEYIIVDGNGQPIGKLTIAPRSGYVVKDGYTGKIS